MNVSPYFAGSAEENFHFFLPAGRFCGKLGL